MFDYVEIRCVKMPWWIKGESSEVWKAKNWYGGLETRDVPIRVNWGRMGMLDNR
jgi:hypothetical protein